MMDDVDRPVTQGSFAAWDQGAGGGNYRNTTTAMQEPLDNEAIQKKGCWYNFSTCVSRMWATRQMTKAEDREIYVRTTLRELVIYIIFLVILCILTFGMTSPTMYYYTKVLSDLFLDAPYPDTRNTFRGSTQVADFWRFTENVMLDGLYWEYWYDPSTTETDEDDRNILYENRMLGVPRIRQVKVRNDSCVVPPDFQGAIRQCFDIYSEPAEDKSPYGIGVNGTAWEYTSEKDLNGSSHRGKIAVYSGAGFYMDLGLNKSQSKEILANLRANLWIQRGTRAVFIDFTVYNANINLFCVIKLVFEFPATGGLIPSWSFRTVKLLRYVTPLDHFVLACEFIFVFFIIYYIIEEALEIKALKCAYFKSMWNILDIVVILISLLCIGFSVFCTLTISGKLQELLEDPNTFSDFEFLGFWQTQFNSAVAVCVFFAWFKLFKYISFNKTMTQLSSTLSRCAKDVAGFAIMFFIVFFAFSQLGYLLFGTQVRDFRSFIDAVFTLLRTILGDFNFHEIEDANRVLGPIFFLSYVFFVFFVLLNMFLAIINDTYSEVKAEIASQRNEFEIADYFKRGYNNMMGKLGKRDKLIDIQNAIKLADQNKDGCLTYDEVRINLKRCNFSDMEIEMFFAKYDIDGSRIIDEQEYKLMLADLDGHTKDIDHQINRSTKPSSGKTSSEAETRPASASSCPAYSGPSQEEFSVLVRRVDRLEHSIGSIVSKIDAVLVKLDVMEKSKHKRREAMEKILDTITDDDSNDYGKRKQMEQLVRNQLENDRN